MLAAEGRALEVLAHGAAHIRFQSRVESLVECWNYDHRRAVLDAFGRAGVHFTRKVFGELLVSAIFVGAVIYALGVNASIFASALVDGSYPSITLSTQARAKSGTNLESQSCQPKMVRPAW